MKLARITLRLFLCLIICFSIVFTLVFGRYKINQAHSFGSAESYKGILTLWQIDSFEGGTGSRKQFLLKVARSFEKQNDGILVMVVEHTEQSLKESLKNQPPPDMISFGTGVEISGFCQLNFSCNSIGGRVGEHTYAIPWCKGGYVLIANPKLVENIDEKVDGILVSQAEYTQPVTALYLDGILADNVTAKKPMEAYVQFVSGKTPYFLGTQRDIIRLERRQMEVLTRPINSFNDLYQYISVTAINSVKQYYSQKFIEHLLDKNSQEGLSEIGMFSDFYSVEYQNQHLSSMQTVKSKSTVSAFASPASLKEMQENALLLVGGRKELEIKIKNMLV